MITTNRILSAGLAALLLLQNSAELMADRPTLNAIGADPQPLPAAYKSAADYVSGPPLEEVVELASWEIAALAERFAYESQAAKAKAEGVRRELKRREESFKATAKATEKQIETREKELQKLSQLADDPATQKNRKRIQCEIVATRKELIDRTFEFLQQQIASDVHIAKLTLLAEWRGASQQIHRKIGDGSIAQRRFGNVLDIGARSSQKPFRGQEDDLKWGQAEVNAARQRNQLPKEIDDPVITEYVNRLANNLARHSDLTVPPKIFVVQQEVRKHGRPVRDKDGQPQQVANAMALPGGYLFVFAGLILDAETESEVAGVIAHEMAHTSARHSHRMANQRKWFNVAQLGAMIGLQIFAPGLFQAASYLGYQLKGLLLQGIFDSLGLIFTLDALGVSRDFELEADQLGMQNAWKAGYDPRGFFNLFDRMSQKEGYASRTAFFATHPAFGVRILNALKEHKALQAVGPDRQFLTDTSEFHDVKDRLRGLLGKTALRKSKDSAQPTLDPEKIEPLDCAEVLSTVPPFPTIPARPSPSPVPEKTSGDDDRPPVLRRQAEPTGQALDQITKPLHVRAQAVGLSGTESLESQSLPAAARRQ